MKSIFFTFFVSVFLFGCESDQEDKKSFANDEFSKIIFTHQLEKLKKETKVYCSYKGDEVQVKVHEKPYGYDLKVKNKETIISRKKLKCMRLKIPLILKSLPN